LEIKVLSKYALAELRKNNDSNRELFLKLSLVFLVTRFQVFIESALKEFDYLLKNSGKPSKHLPINYRLNSLKLHLQRNSVQIELEKSNVYDLPKLNNAKAKIDIYSKLIDDNVIIFSDYCLNCKLPLGKGGLNEIVDLFKQISGVNIFDGSLIDTNKLNEILYRRHNIIHEDGNQQLTEQKIEEYLNCINETVILIDTYLRKFLTKKYRP